MAAAREAPNVRLARAGALEEMLGIVEESSLEEAPERLIALANDRGGDDNITVVVIRVQEPTPA